MDIIQSCTV